MTARIYNSIRRYTQNEFIEGLGEPSTNLYFWIGKTSAWTDDNNPPLPTESVTDLFDNGNDMLALKKVSTSDVIQVVRRYNWISGTVYVAYSDTDTDLFNQQFYVMNSANRVYKCISNNNGIASTVEPTGTSTALLTTADGYIWKYLYTLTTNDVSTFLSSSWMPVRVDSAVSTAAVDGAIDSIVITNGGTGYSSPTVTINSNTGSGATATASVTSGAITGITITNAGTGYRDATVTISGGGSGAEATVVIGPFGGHGIDPLRELGCRTTMYVISLDGDEGGDFPVGISYRKLGLILNPLLDADDTLAIDTTYPGGDIKLGSGEQFYVEHRKPIARNADDQEIYKIVVFS